VSQVINYLVKEGISHRADLEKAGSPQSYAADWIANEDDMNLAVPDSDSTALGYDFVTRYVLSVIWFGMGGSSWMFQYGFNSKNHHCFWNTAVPVQTSSGIDFQPGGVYCENGGARIAAIHLGKFPRPFLFQSLLERF
jgi:hypothetical protein